MATTLRIPLLPQVTDQLVSVEFDGNPYILRVLWNERFGYFSLSIYTADGTPILLNVKMVKDYPLIGRYKSVLLPRDEFYFVQEKGAPKRPDFDDLATNFELYYHEAGTVVTAQPVRVTVAPPFVSTVWDSGLTTWDGGATTWDV